MRMKPALVSGLVLSLTAFPAYAGDFEGVIQMKNSHVDTGTTSTMNWYIKGDRGRVEMSRTDNQTQVMLFDGKTRTMQMGMPGQKSYMEISLEGDRGDHLKELLDTQSVERTGKTDTIAGYTCEVWRITDKEHHRAKSELCVAKGFGKAATFWIDPKEARRSSQPAWVKQLVEEGGFGLRSIQYDEAGKESVRMEVVSIEKKNFGRESVCVSRRLGEARHGGVARTDEGHAGAEERRRGRCLEDDRGDEEAKGCAGQIRRDSGRRRAAARHERVDEAVRRSDEETAAATTGRPIVRRLSAWRERSTMPPCPE